MPGLSDYLKIGGGLVHRTANIVGDVKIGEGTRIDAFVTITGDVEIGAYTHIGALVCIFGGAGVRIGDYVGVSPGVKIFTGTEDVSGEWVTNPTVPPDLRNPRLSRVEIADHAFIGANSVLLPGARLNEGSGLGALSLCKSELAEWSIYAGCPAKWVRERTTGVRQKVNPVLQEYLHAGP